jgi:hypothetical protein
VLPLVWSVLEEESKVGRISAEQAVDEARNSRNDRSSYQTIGRMVSLSWPSPEPRTDRSSRSGSVTHYVGT